MSRRLIRSATGIDAEDRFGAWATEEISPWHGTMPIFPSTCSAEPMGIIAVP